MPAVFKEITKSSSFLPTVAEDIHYNAFQYQHKPKTASQKHCNPQVIFDNFYYVFQNIICVFHKEHDLCYLVFQVVYDDFPQHIYKKEAKNSSSQIS